MKSLGYRDPMTYRKLSTVESLSLTNHILNIERMFKNHENVRLHQYVHELMQSKDPRKSNWFGTK